MENKKQCPAGYEVTKEDCDHCGQCRDFKSKYLVRGKETVSSALAREELYRRQV